MKIINLRDFYPFYTTNQFVEVSDEVAVAMYEADRLEKNYTRRMYRHRAHYSLDAGDGIEYEALFISLTPYEIYERKLIAEQLCAALNSLPDIQARRIHAHYILGISQTEIARIEGVGKSSVSECIELGLRNMEKYLKNIL